MKKPNDILKSINPLKLAKKVSRQKELVGKAPGSLIYTGSIVDKPVEISIIRYGEDYFDEFILKNVSEANLEKEIDHISWINVSGIHDVDIVKTIGDDFNLHSLLLEDILNIEQRPKVEVYGENIVVFFKMLYLTDGVLEIEPISLVLGPNYIISFQEKEGDIFDNIRDRIRNGNGKIRKRKSDYLMFALMDAVVDNYFIVMEDIAEKLELLEDRLFEETDNSLLFELQMYRKQIVSMRRSIYPLREVVNKLNRTEFERISDDTERFFRDLYDHTIQIIETIETFKETVSSLKDVYMTGVSNRMNEIMKVLTLIATIFIPITFVAGVYGMNFEYMPELSWKYGYESAWLLMVSMSLAMIVYFKKKKWL
ncbi:MAG: magnesium/cobalt transporter CorA [Candidatus Kapaibacterium sp.]|nr:magnesium/cobalt transporter CorA [Ignavibacteriota bacterium]MCB9221197.1 magnesium/cobalt transporter CorA [Ignavibacteria bacterium]